MFSGAKRAKWNGREDEDWESLILNPITGFEERHTHKKKSGKDSSSPTDFLHFKDFPCPLNQKYYGARYFSGKKCTCFFRICTWYRSLSTFLRKKKKRGVEGRHSIPWLLNKPCLQEMQASGDCSAAHPSISARPRVCVSTMHVLPRALTPHAGPNGRCANGRQVSVACSQRCSQARCPCLSRIPFFCLCLASQKP